MDAIVEAIKKCYYAKTVQNLPIYGVPSKVKKFVQSESEAKKGKSKNIPTNQYRLYEEDIEPPSGAFTSQFLNGGGEYVQERGPSVYDREQRPEIQQVNGQQAAYYESEMYETKKPYEYNEQDYEKNNFEQQRGQNIQWQSKSDDYQYQWQQGASQSTKPIYQNQSQTA